MILETIILNRVYKTKVFTRLMPRINQDQVVFAITNNIKMMNSQSLGKDQKDDILCTQQEAEEFFDTKYNTFAANQMFHGMEL